MERRNKSRSLKILFTTGGYKPAYRIGGPILSVSSIAEHLVKRGHKVVVFTSNSNLGEDIDVPLNQPVLVDGVEVWYLRRYEPLKAISPFFPYFSQSLGFLYTPDLIKILDNQFNGFDLIHTHMPFIYPTIAAAKHATKNKIPLFYQPRGAFSPGYMKFRRLKKRIYIKLIEKQIMEKSTKLIALTEAERNEIRKLGLFGDCEVIPNGIDIDKYITKEELTKFKEVTYKIDKNRFLILFLARLHVIKGVDFLLDAFIQVEKYFPEALLVLAGPDQHGMKEQLYSKIRSNNLSKSVILPGMVSGAMKQYLLARADLFCLPSAAEGFSMAVLEAMASETPVMISPECNIPDVAEKKAGWIVERDVRSWQIHIINAIKNREQLSNMGKKGRDFVLRSYTWSAVIDKLETVYYDSIKRNDLNMNP